jgi:hypothetical protein
MMLSRKNAGSTPKMQTVLYRLKCAMQDSNNAAWLKIEKTEMEDPMQSESKDE